MAWLLAGWQRARREQTPDTWLDTIIEENLADEASSYTRSITRPEQIGQGIQKTTQPADQAAGANEDHTTRQATRRPSLQTFKSLTGSLRSKTSAQSSTTITAAKAIFHDPTIDGTTVFAPAPARDVKSQARVSITSPDTQATIQPPVASAVVLVRRFVASLPPEHPDGYHREFNPHQEIVPPPLFDECPNCTGDHRRYGRPPFAIRDFDVCNGSPRTKRSSTPPLAAPSPPSPASPSVWGPSSRTNTAVGIDGHGDVSIITGNDGTPIATNIGGTERELVGFGKFAVPSDMPLEALKQKISQQYAHGGGHNLYGSRATNYAPNPLVVVFNKRRDAAIAAGLPVPSPLDDEITEYSMANRFAKRALRIVPPFRDDSGTEVHIGFGAGPSCYKPTDNFSNVNTFNRWNFAAQQGTHDDDLTSAHCRSDDRTVRRPSHWDHLLPGADEALPGATTLLSARPMPASFIERAAMAGRQRRLAQRRMLEAPAPELPASRAEAALEAFSQAETLVTAPRVVEQMRPVGGLKDSPE